MPHLPSIWPITDVVILDCDSTLTAVEGIDELARLTDSADDVAALTQRAMDGEIPLESVYRYRLDISNPTRAQVNYLQRIYRENAIADARQVVEALQDLGCKVFVVSGGLIEPVRDFAVWLGVPREHVYAVDMEFDQLAGRWWRYWEQPGGNNPQANYLAVPDNPLVGTGGKSRIIGLIRADHAGRALLLGDGLSDLEAQGQVELFVGFGGVVYRERVARESPIYVRTPGLAPLLPLALGRLAAARVSRWAPLYAEGLRHVTRGEVLFNDRALEKAFVEAVLSNGAR